MTQSSLPLPQPNRGLFWALVPVALLVSSALGVGSMAIVAARDPHFATEPDYYQKAIRWDRTQAQAATNQHLGFAIAAPASVGFDSRGHAQLDLTITDSLGRPVPGARVSGEAFANAYAGKVIPLSFSEQAAGRYRAQLTAQQPGLWIFRIAGNAGSERFTADFRADLTPGGAR